MRIRVAVVSTTMAAWVFLIVAQTGSPAAWTKRLLTDPMGLRKERLAVWIPADFTTHFHRHKNTDNYYGPRNQSVRLTYAPTGARLLPHFPQTLPFEHRTLGKAAAMLRAIPFPGDHPVFVSTAYGEVKVHGITIAFNIDLDVSPKNTDAVAWSLCRRIAEANP